MTVAENEPRAATWFTAMLTFVAYDVKLERGACPPVPFWNAGPVPVFHLSAQAMKNGTANLSRFRAPYFLSPLFPSPFRMALMMVTSPAKPNTRQMNPLEVAPRTMATIPMMKHMIVKVI